MSAFRPEPDLATRSAERPFRARSGQVFALEFGLQTEAKIDARAHNIGGVVDIDKSRRQKRELSLSATSGR
jgi:hypothetical protein